VEVQTTRLYHDQPYLRRFEARVLAVREGERPALALDRTAFYPGGGGQPPDRGWIQGIPVVNVEPGEDGFGVVWHVLSLQDGVAGRSVRPAAGHDAGAAAPAVAQQAARAASPAAGDTVQCEVDWVRRFDFMQQHTGQHIVSAVALAGFGAQTTSFHLGEETSSLDLAFPRLAAGDPGAVEQALFQLEKAACSEVFADRPIRTHHVTPGETPEGVSPGLALRVRRRGPAPKAEGSWRVVEICELDLSPCGGTHVQATGETGLIVFQRWERMHDSIRIEFACGWRALKAYSWRNQDLKRLGRELSAPEREAVEQAIRVIAGASEQARELGRLRETVLEQEAAGLAGGAEPMGGTLVVCRVLAGRSAEEVKQLAIGIARRPGYAALLGTVAGGAGPRLVFARAEDLSLDVRAPMAAAVTVLGGRGGGAPKIAQGGGGDPAKLEDALAAAAECIRASLGAGQTGR
jgi:alanyl-tRNA synthetase